MHHLGPHARRGPYGELPRVFWVTTLTPGILRLLAKQVSRREDPFQDLSLPIPEDKAPRNVHAGHGKRAKGKLGGRAATGRAGALSGGGAADPTEADEEDNVSPDLASQVEVLHLEEAPGGVKEPPEGSLDACLRSFTAPELLAGKSSRGRSVCRMRPKVPRSERSDIGGTPTLLCGGCSSQQSCPLHSSRGIGTWYTDVVPCCFSGILLFEHGGIPRVLPLSLRECSREFLTVAP